MVKVPVPEFLTAEIGPVGQITPFQTKELKAPMINEGVDPEEVAAKVT